MADFIAIMTNHIPQIKWPNDIVLNNKKIAGILIEKKMIQKKYWFIVGIGLNADQKDFGGIRNAGSILSQTNMEFNLYEIVNSLHTYLQNYLNKDISEELVLKKLNNQLYRRNVISVFEIKGMRQNGIIKEVDADGYLEIELENDGLQKFFHKEITLLY